MLSIFIQEKTEREREIKKIAPGSIHLQFRSVRKGVRILMFYCLTV